jgi:type II secretory pathway pseudopilin PulG
MRDRLKLPGQLNKVKNQKKFPSPDGYLGLYESKIMGRSKKKATLATHKNRKIIKIERLEPKCNEFILYMYPSVVRQRRSNADRLIDGKYRVRIIQKDPIRDPSGTASFSINKRFRRGTTLVEVAVAILIMIISLLGVSTTYVSGKKQILKQSQYQQAVNLASDKIEEMKALGYASLEVDDEEDAEQGENEESLSLFGLPCTRKTMIELTAQPSADVPNPCKKVTVTVQWTGLASDEHEVKLITYVGP